MAVKPLREAVDKPKNPCGVLTMAEVMLMMRPKRRSLMPSTTARMSIRGASMLLFTASCHSLSLQSAKRPGGGPPLLVTRMSGAGRACSTRARPSVLSRSPTTGMTDTSSASISFAVASRVVSSRPLITRLQPSCANARAQALPSPREEAQTMALLPASPRSMSVSLYLTARYARRECSRDVCPLLNIQQQFFAWFRRRFHRAVTVVIGAFADRCHSLAACLGGCRYRLHFLTEVPDQQLHLDGHERAKSALREGIQAVFACCVWVVAKAACSASPVSSARAARRKWATSATDAGADCNLSRISSILAKPRSRVLL